MEFQTVTDQIGRKVRIPKQPKRIVSLVPSQTELLFELGLDERVVGITKFCIHPEPWFQCKTRVGGTKQLNFNSIESLNPDLIIANKEENNREDIEELQTRFPVWVSDVADLNSALEMIKSVGDITDSESTDLITQIRTEFNNLKPTQIPCKVLYLIWNKPCMAAGTGTFIDDMLNRCGFQNVVSEERYPEVSQSELVDLNPDLVMLSSEPYPFGETHAQIIRGFLPNTEVKLVDGEMFSWYGSRIRLAPLYFKQLI